MSGVMDEVEKMLGAEIADPDALKLEAKKRVEEYFRVSAVRGWDLLSPTYQSKVKKEAFVKAWKKWKPAVSKVVVTGVELSSGVLAEVKAILFADDGSVLQRAEISVIKEGGPYSIDPGAPFRIVGTSVIPYCQSTA